jgi:replicative DNA helicase
VETRPTVERFPAQSEKQLATNGKTIVPPQNLEAEESVLGAMMVSESTIEPVLLDVRLHAEDFYRDRHRTIYEAIIHLNENADPVDVLTVSEALAKHGQLDAIGGRDVVASLAAKVPAPGSASHYAQIVKQNSLMRRLDSAAKQIQASVAERDGEPSEMVEQAERLLFQVAHEERAVDFREIGEILHDEIDKLEALASGTSDITGTPSGFRDLDDKTGGFQPGNLIVIAARPAMGKCQGGRTLVYDAKTGARRRLDEVVESHEAGEELWIAAVGRDLKLRPALVSHAIRSGKQMLYRLTTRLGRRIEATANHPLLTLGGWRPLRELEAGSRIAVPRRLPRMSPAQEMDDHRIVLLAALIADGSIIRGTPMFTFGTEGSKLVEEVKEAAEGAGVGFNVGREGRYAYLSLGRGAPRNPVTELCREHGVWGKRSEDKFIPEAIFELPDHQIARFLAVLFGCDGYVHCTERLAHIGYTTISEQLARDVQHLLLRLGIVSCIRTLKRDVYEGTDKVAREVRITDQRSLARFAMSIRIVGKEDGLGAVLDRLVGSTSMTNVDTAPVEVWDKVLAAKGERSWAEVSEAAGYPRNHNWHVGKRGLSRSRLLQMADVLDAPELEEFGDSDIWWDEVASIEEIGAEETYDLTVPDHHNFVADDVIVHNSTLVCDFAQNVALKHQKPVALFSLEMSEMELAHRFIGSQSRISSDRLRKGKVAAKDWPKVVKACNQLESAPLWIDDSSDLGLLELRAKARRLHAQEKGRGHDGLGMVIVDYLQLMRSDDARANRVEQVSQFSRGLKILARELAVPVIGISQLSRAPEQRPDKRPILSDLRDSGAIEQDADVVGFLYRDDYYNQESEDPGGAELILAKHRNGPVGTVRLVFLEHYPKFADRAREERPVEQLAGEGPPIGNFADAEEG